MALMNDIVVFFLSKTEELKIFPILSEIGLIMSV